METAEQIVQDMAAVATEEHANSEPVPLEHAFSLDYEAPNGQRYRGDFVNRILSVADWITVSTVKSRMLGGAVFESIDQSTLSLCEMLAHMALSLKERPGWFDSEKIHEPLVIEAVYKEVMAHQVRFRGLDGGPEDDGGEDRV